MTEIRLRPSRGWGRFDWRALWAARDLIVLLVRRDFVVKHVQTILGPLWFVIQPLALSVVLFLAVNKGAGVRTDGVPPFLFNLCSLAPWFYFSQTFAAVGSTFINHVGLFRKVYFPRAAVPIALAVANLIPLGIQLMLFLIAVWLYAAMGEPVWLSWTAILVPLLMVQLVLLTLGAGLCTAALTARYRDLSHALQFILLLAMFASLVFVPASSLPADLWWVTWVNPLATIIEGTRAAAFGLPGPSGGNVLASCMITAAVVIAGVLAFERATRIAIDTA